MTPLRSDVSELDDDVGSQGAFEVDAVVFVVGGSEVRVDREYSARRGGRARITDRGREDRNVFDNRCVRSAICCRYGVDRACAARVAFDSIRSLVARAVIEEGIEVWRVGVPAVAGADDGIAVQRIAEADTWAEILVVPGKERVDLAPLEG